jgi:DNA polymerase V
MNHENPDGVSVHDGFPNPATDSSLQLLDLNKLLIRHRISTYFMRIAGNDWQEQGIFDGDIVLVDRALKPRSNDLVIWWEGESFHISPKHAVPPDTPTWGVVTFTIHQFRGTP